MKPIDKLADDLISFEARHPEIVNPTGKVMEETDDQKLICFAKMREERAKATDAFGNKTYEDVWDNISQEEEDYYREKRRKEDPAKRYQRLKKEWYFHESSGYMRGVKNGYDGQGCHDGICVPECRYYEPEGRVEFEEVEQKIQEYDNNKSGSDGS